jgi:hypothetical protein
VDKRAVRAFHEQRFPFKALVPNDEKPNQRNYVTNLPFLLWLQERQIATASLIYSSTFIGDEF